MADELTRLQDVYLHAVTRYVLLQREVDAYLLANRNASLEGTKSANQGGETPHRYRHRRGGSSRSSRRRESEGERRERLLTAGARIAPSLGFDGVKGTSSLKGIR